jgi:Flp pilus assembly protein TadG
MVDDHVGFSHGVCANSISQDRIMFRRRGWNEGSVAVEGAIALSVLIALILGIIQFGIAFYNLNTMQLAIEEVGRYAMVNYAGATTCPSADPNLVAQENQVLTSYPVMNATVTASCSGASPLLLTITGSFTTLNLLVTIPQVSTQITVPLT